MTTKTLHLIKVSEIIILFMLLVFFSACEKRGLQPISYPEVAEELCPYFQKFEEEASTRGIKIDLKTAQIKGRFSTIQDGYVGLCTITPKKEIIIDKYFWKRSNELVRELIVFHELGHCYLDRRHSNKKRANGTCLSIMRSGNGSCIDFYTTKTRSQLLDELFLQ